MVHIGRGRALVLLLLLCGALLFGARPSGAQPEATTIDIVQVSGFVDPPVARHVEDRLAAAGANGADLVVLQVDSPGGLQVSSERLLDAIEDCRVPVVGWVAPREARATSTGALLAFGGFATYVAESTEIGPLNAPLDGGSPSTTSSSDLEDLAALDRTIDGATAVERGLVKGEASSLGDLLRALDGEAMDELGLGVGFETWDESVGAPSATIRFAEMNPFARLLHAVTEPKIALLLFLAGLFGIIFELYNPGIGLAAIVGAGSLALSIYSLSILPTNWGALLVVATGIALLVFDLHAAALGFASFAGTAALVGGSAFLFAGAPEPLQLSPWAIAAAVAVTLLFFISVMTAALRVRLRRPVDDEDKLVGTIGEATTDIAPEGTVLTKGTLWRARTMETGIAAGAKVEVKATEGLVLLVEPLHERDTAGD